jgi:hypothetical protein
MGLARRARAKWITTGMWIMASKIWTITQDGTQVAERKSERGARAWAERLSGDNTDSLIVVVDPSGDIVTTFTPMVPMDEVIADDVATDESATDVETSDDGVTLVPMGRTMVAEDEDESDVADEITEALADLESLITDPALLVAGMTSANVRLDSWYRKVEKETRRALSSGKSGRHLLGGPNGIGEVLSERRTLYPLVNAAYEFHFDGEKCFTFRESDKSLHAIDVTSRLMFTHVAPNYDGMNAEEALRAYIESKWAGYRLLWVSFSAVSGDDTELPNEERFSWLILRGMNRYNYAYRIHTATLRENGISDKDLADIIHYANGKETPEDLGITFVAKMGSYRGCTAELITDWQGARDAFPATDATDESEDANESEDAES